MARPSAAVRFSEALQNMRQEAHRGVWEGINSAMAVAPAPPKRKVSYFTPGQAVALLVDGVLDAIVDLVFRTARPGLQVAYANLIAEQLVAKVEKRAGVVTH
jgi:hypothetical protein